MSKSDERVKGLIKRFLNKGISPGLTVLTITVNVKVETFVDHEGISYLRVIVFGSRIVDLHLLKENGREILELELTTKGFNTTTTTRYLHAALSSIPILLPVSINLLKGQCAFSLGSFQKIPFERVVISYDRLAPANLYRVYELKVNDELLINEVSRR